MFGLIILSIFLPKIKFEEIYNMYPPELANRFFDTISIQKGTSKLLIMCSLISSLIAMYFLIVGSKTGFSKSLDITSEWIVQILSNSGYILKTLSATGLC